jgi:hypothetical protein
MRLHLVHLLVFLVLVFPLVPYAPVTSEDAAVADLASQAAPGSVLAEGTEKYAEVVTPGPDLGRANWTSNHFRNPGFEEWYSPQTPSYWNPWAEGDRYAWVATAANGHVSEGARSGGLWCSARYERSAYTFLAQWGVNADARNLSLTLDWFLDQNDDPAQDTFYLQVTLVSDTSWHSISYYLNGTTTPSNQTYYGYFSVPGSRHQWNTLSRNVTADFLAIPAFPGAIPATLQLSEFYVQLRAQPGTYQQLRAFIDDMVVENEATTWIGSSVRNGNFETGYFTPWGTPGNRDASDARRSSTAHTGSWSMNMTAASQGNDSYSYMYTYPYSRVTNQNQAKLRFWWHLDYDNPASGCSAYVYMYYYNGTHFHYLYYLLGYCGYAPASNSSGQFVLHADNFNTTGSWVYFERNLWTDFTTGFGGSQFVPENIYFWVQTQSAGSRVVTLFDDAGFIAPAINDAGYEDQGIPGTPIQGWYWQDVRFAVTDTVVYAGNKAANLTLSSGQSFDISQTLQDRPLNSTRETYLDAMWRLEDYTPDPANSAILQLWFANGQSLIYVLAGSSGNWGNDTYYCYFNVTGVGTLGTWMQLHRDLTHDYQAAFGLLPDLTLDYIVFAAFMPAGGRLELLLDDLYLYDDPAPRITNVQRAPTSPSHNQPVQVSADVQEQDVDVALLHYRLNGGGWSEGAMTLQSGNTYRATIPGQPHGTFIEYYVTANDTWGMTATALDGTGYWSYMALDQTPPTIGSLSRTPTNPTYLDQGNVSAVIADPETGLDTVVLYYRANGGAWTPVPMTGTGSLDGYYAYVPVRPWSTIVEYYFNATNLVGLSNIEDNSGSYYGYTVGDAINPVISNLLRVPTVVGYLDIPVVTCDVTDAGSGVGTVLIFYRLDGSPWGSTPMTHTTGDQYQISGGAAQPLGTFVEYYINASDSAGNWVVDDNSGAYYGYTVGDNVKPSVLITAPSPGEVLSGVVNITVFASDAVSGISRVEFYVDDVLVFNDTLAPYQFNWYTVSLGNGLHTIKAVAFDAAGNWADDTVTISLSNPTPPPPSPLPLLLIAGAVGIGVVVVVAVVFVLRRRTK